MAFEHGLLWQLQNEDKSVSYLLGTIHLNSSFYLQKQFMFSSIMDSCNLFAAEIDLDRMNNEVINKFLRMPIEEDWKSLLKLNQWNKMKLLCEKRFQIDLDNYTNIFPLVLVNQLSLQLIGRNIETSMDQNLWEMAQTKNIKTCGLEDFDQHFGLIGKLDINDQVKMLKDLLKNLKKSRKTYNKMLEDYQNEDLRAIYTTSKKMLGRYRHLMLYDRNQKMFNKITGLITHNNCFITCGAGHLFGAYGILRLLKNQGLILKHVAI